MPPPVALDWLGAHRRTATRRRGGAAARLRQQRRGVPDDRAARARASPPSRRASTAERGLDAAWWPGRFEIVRAEPTIVLDGAHNGSSGEALAAALRQRFGRRPIHLIVGLNTDKDARATLRPLFEVARRVTVTTSSAPRARAADDLAKGCRSLSTVPVGSAPDVERALATAIAGARPNEVVCVTGSLALVGAARDALGLRPPERLWPDRLR